MSPATITLLILLLALILFVTERIPLAVTAILVDVLLVFTGVLPAKDAFSGLSNSTVVLFAATFVIGAALFRTGVAKLIGDTVIKGAGKSELRLLLAVMIVAGGLSAVLSNTGTTAVLLPIVMAIAASAGLSNKRLLMPLAYATSLGGMLTLVGTPPNVIAKATLDQAKLASFGFFEYAKIGIPMAIIGTIYMLTLGKKLLSTGDAAEVEDVAKASAAQLESEGLSQETSGRGKADVIRMWISGLVLLAAVVVMAWGKYPLEVVAVTGALIVVITGCLKIEEAYKAIDWTTIFLFAGMLPMSKALEKTGAGKMIAEAVIGVMGSNPSPYLITAVLFILACGLTNFMSNTATAALLCPIGLAIAQGLGADPRAVVMAIAVGCSCAFMTPVGTPPNTIVLGPARYRFTDYVIVGAPLTLLTFIVAVILLPLLWPFYH
ncbi:MAG: SLC13 family permease [Thermanaeromonas sp.]|uniref:SLC13 family permease n=1 Tax=Thermanaeromonas sp. TaxID=2003697 RepID=UPI00243EA215|nr:SLC13 family permease [Thermanaeromonas sp.]MCG0277788.1 SLC13 family permease [Thermanaeromonas sp.]